MIAPSSIKELFIAHFGEQANAALFSPGRVNLIGEHIDYNGGLVMPCAISLGITALVRRNYGDTVRVYSKDFDESISIHLENDFPYKQHSLQIHWSDYIKATLQVLTDKGVRLKGMDILLSSDLPLGSGLSSSAAIECLIAYMFNSYYYDENRTDLALDAQQAERKYIGVNCGIMDQFAVSQGKKNHAIVLNCATLDYEHIPVDFGEYGLVIINTNKPRRLAESKYNERRSECEQALSIIQNFAPAENLCQAPEITLAYIENDTLYARAKHCILENKRVQNAALFLKQNNIEAFGDLLVESHISLDEAYEVSCDELNTIVHYATHFEDCIGARMTGAGFGGCCIAFVKKDKIQQFISYVGIKYEQKMRLNADFYICEIADGVHEIEL